MSTSHIGTVNTSTINLSNTYHVPNLTFNLVSVGQLCNLGLTIVFSSHGYQVQNPQTGQVIGTGRKASLSRPYPFFTDPFTNLFPTSDSPPDTTPCPPLTSELTQSYTIFALPDLTCAPCEEPEPTHVR
ncbi:Retrovirus-related Pol polyprotein from transposon TNT 1-94 [Cucumis melo var. makuwa]|uniref:Retrovirus-related Pol polyprotein from transposon TNT 1-94 n=1 Tax=Cucumis melo var. makuwa TaxID=1194695 RepID=A0A5D3BQ57_CUCMM|nr:Retrovirus-related Pol polyprotein from transposon TNT 1-94 [Cucumis melo var. makuwa]TYK01188.1 Retrovirus-related Pol polyprotein from transposon TNT 1-94 [Cucumis melo var. makuwa]